MASVPSQKLGSERNIMATLRSVMSGQRSWLIAATTPVTAP